MRRRVAEQEIANNDLIVHNMQLGQKVNAYYDVRRRIHNYKELLARHTEFLRHSDLRNDEELMAIIESRLETEKSFENPDFGVKELAYDRYIPDAHLRTVPSLISVQDGR